MKIEFTTGVAGARFAYEPGEIVDLRVDLAKEFIKAGQAVEVRDNAEFAVAGAPELAATRTGGRRRTVRNLGGLLNG